ncbi:MAG: NADH-quinone oxidoreductase subunit N [Anaerosomatales bacterium]
MTEVSMLVAFAPHIACVIGAAAAVAADAFERRGLAITLAVLGLIGGAALAFASSARAPELTGDVVLSGTGFSATVGITCTIAALVLLGSWRPLTEAEHGGGLAALAAVSVAAAASAAVAADVLVLLIALEAMALCAYALVWSARTAAATEAAVKYFVQGAIATGLFVLGLAILFGLYGGSTSYVWIRGVMGAESGPPVTTAFVLIGVALAYKIGAFPFHSWALDAFESAPPHFAALLAGVPKLAVVVAMIILFSRSVFAGLDAAYTLWVFAILAVLSMAFGATGGLLQRSYTRMLAYSGVAQIGYALVGVALGAVSMTSVALLMTAYALAAAGAFLAAGSFAAARPGWDGTIAGLAGLGRERPWLGAAVAVAMFSLIGMPLTAGFWGKFLVFGVAVSAGYWWLALVGVIASVISFGYYGAVLKNLYFESAPPRDHAAAEARPDRVSEVAVVVTALLVLAIGCAPLLFGLQQILRVLTFA